MGHVTLPCKVDFMQALCMNIQIEFELEMLDSEEGRKLRTENKNIWSKARVHTKLNPRMTPSLAFKPGQCI